MKITKCQKCGSKNILLIKLNPDYVEDIQETSIECQDCGFEIRKRTDREIRENLWEKEEAEEKEKKRKKAWEDVFEEGKNKNSIG